MNLFVTSFGNYSQTSGENACVSRIYRALHKPASALSSPPHACAPAVLSCFQLQLCTIASAWNALLGPIPPKWFLQLTNTCLALRLEAQWTTTRSVGSHCTSQSQRQWQWRTAHPVSGSFLCPNQDHLIPTSSFSHWCEDHFYADVINLTSVQLDGTWPGA